MKSIVGLMLVAMVALIATGCDKAKEEAAQNDVSSVSANVAGKTTVSLEAGQACESCCSGETCAHCGMEKATSSCCSGVESAGVAVALVKGTEKCCSESNETCSYGAAKEAPACCQEAPACCQEAKDGDHEGHDHDGDEHK